MTLESHRLLLSWSARKGEMNGKFLAYILHRYMIIIPIPHNRRKEARTP